MDSMECVDDNISIIYRKSWHYFIPSYLFISYVLFCPIPGFLCYVSLLLYYHSVYFRGFTGQLRWPGAISCNCMHCSFIRSGRCLGLRPALRTWQIVDGQSDPSLVIAAVFFQFCAITRRLDIIQMPVLLGSHLLRTSRELHSMWGDYEPHVIVRNVIILY